jgi:hypothetical protein
LSSGSCFFQWEWGRESTTLSLLQDFFKMSKSTIHRVLRHKLNAVLEARKRWPRFATLEEDVTLMSAWWYNKYGTKRVILWDDTNINIPAASDSHLNRHTYSAYYAGNVAKGAVFLQLCGWMGTWELWAGAISDTEYQARSGVFKYMQWFVDDFDKGIPFTNIVDKGYLCIMAAWQAGKQLFLQPAFARSDRKFNTREVNRSSTVASDRSGNERAGVFKRGLRPNESPEVIADVRIAWGFQANFMFKSVL